MSRKHHAVGRGEFVGSVVFLPLSSDPTERECRFYFGSCLENADCILVKMKGSNLVLVRKMQVPYCQGNAAT